MDGKSHPPNSADPKPPHSVTWKMFLLIDFPCQRELLCCVRAGHGQPAPPSIRRNAWYGGAPPFGFVFRGLALHAPMCRYL